MKNLKNNYITVTKRAKLTVDTEEKSMLKEFFEKDFNSKISRVISGDENLKDLFSLVIEEYENNSDLEYKICNKSEPLESKIKAFLDDSKYTLSPAEEFEFRSLFYVNKQKIVEIISLGCLDPKENGTRPSHVSLRLIEDDNSHLSEKERLKVIVFTPYRERRLDMVIPFKLKSEKVAIVFLLTLGALLSRKIEYCYQLRNDNWGMRHS